MTRTLTRPTVLATVLLLLLPPLLAGSGDTTTGTATTGTAATGTAPELRPVPRPDLSRLDAAVAEQLGAERRRLDELLERDDPEAGALADRFGAVGRLYLAYDLRAAAAAALANAAALDPGSFRWHYSAGLVAQRQGEWEAAAERFRRALEIGAPADRPGAAAGAHRRLGEVELELGHGDTAREHFEAALDAAPECHAARYGLGEVARREGRLEEAVVRFRHVLADQPGAVSVHYPLAQVLLRLERPDEAEEHLRASAERAVKVGGRPSCPDPLEAELAELTTGAAAHITRGRHAAFSGERERELAEYRRAVELAPDDPVARLSLGSALVRSGDLPAAAEQYRVAVELSPDDPELRYDLGRILMQLRRGREARQHLLRAVELDPDHAGAHLKLAELTLSGGRFAETLVHARRASELSPGDVRPRLLQAMALLATGRPAEAEPHLAAVAADDTAPEEIRAQARAALEQLRNRP